MRSRLSAGVVIVLDSGPSFRYLLLRSFRYWDFPKGAVEVRESTVDAALREVREETGITDLTFRWGHRYIDTEPYAGGKIARYYLAECRSDKVVLGLATELGRPEHHEYRWVRYHEAVQLLGPRVRKVLDWAHNTISETS